MKNSKNGISTILTGFIRYNLKNNIIKTSSRLAENCGGMFKCPQNQLFACIFVQAVSHKFWEYSSKIETTGAIFSKHWKVEIWSSLTLHTKFQDNHSLVLVMRICVKRSTKVDLHMPLFVTRVIVSAPRFYFSL